MRCASCGNEALPGQQFCAGHLQAGGGGTAAAGDVYASFWRRAGAAVLNYFACVFIAVAIVAFWAAVVGPDLAAPVWLIVFVAYYAGFESSALQATPGKLAMEIKVTTLEGERIGFGRALGRLVGKFVSGIILYIGYLMALFTSHRQALHDKIAGTYVVRKRYSGAQVAQAGPAPPTPAAAIVLVFVVLFGVGIFGVGILAAIAIPAYQDYTIRAQVAEGLNEASAYKVAVAEAHASGQPLAEIGSQSLPFSPSPVSRYVDSIDVANGAIAITYGEQANRNIAGKMLVLVPATDGSGDVTWVCGRAGIPSGLNPSIDAGARLTSLENRYLPASCRGS